MRGLIQFLLLVGSTCGSANAVSNEAYDAAEALLRHDAATDHTYLYGNCKHHPCFVTVAGADLPSEVLARLRETGLVFLPGSDWKLEAGKRVGHDMHVSIGEPELLSDGTFRIKYSFYCGTLCHSTNTAILKRDASGWNVVTTRLETIS